MLRRLSHILIMCTLILATAGVTVTRHYCGSRLVETSLSGEPKSCCGEHCNCCHNEAFSMKVTDNYLSSADTQLPAMKVLSLDWLVSPSLFAFTVPANTFAACINISPHLPPPLIPDNPSAMLQVFLC